MVSIYRAVLPLTAGVLLIARGKPVRGTMLLFSGAVIAATGLLNTDPAAWSFGPTRWSTYQEPNGVSVLLPDNCKQFTHSANFGFGDYPTHAWQSDYADGGSLLFLSVVLPQNTPPTVYAMREVMQKFFAKKNATLTRNTLLNDGRGTLVTMEAVAADTGSLTHVRIYLEGVNEYLLMETPAAGSPGKMLPSFHHL